MDTIHSPQDLDRLRRSAHAYAVVAAWSGAGLFDALAGGPRRLDALPADTRAVVVTVPILLHLGLLQGDGERFELSSSARRLWEQGRLGLGGAENVLGDLSNLDPVLSQGGPVRATEGGVREDDPEAAHAFLDRLFRLSAEVVDATVEVMTTHLEPGARVLDLGGGHGRYGHALAEAGFRVTLFDRPVCCDVARERFGDALEYRSGDFMVDALGGPYEAVLLSNIVHGLGPEENEALLARVRDAVVPGGWIALRDMFLDETRAQPEQAAFFGLTMLLYTREGQVYTLEQTRELCRSAGLVPDRHVTLYDQGSAFVLARRPSAAASR